MSRLHRTLWLSSHSWHRLKLSHNNSCFRLKETKLFLTARAGVVLLYARKNRHRKNLRYANYNFSIASWNSTDNYEKVPPQSSSGITLRSPSSDVIQWTTGWKISKIEGGGNVSDLIGTSINFNPYRLISGGHTSDVSRGQRKLAVSIGSWSHSDVRMTWNK